MSADRLGACTSTLDSNLTAGMDPGQTQRAHRQCVQEAFGERLGALCERAHQLCEAADAVPEICTQIAEACTTVNP